MDQGVFLFHGEAEAEWASVLQDCATGEIEKRREKTFCETCKGSHQNFYRGGQPSLEKAALPYYPPGYFDGFVGRTYTVDSGRGCPFHCSFCTIINVQGNNPRYRGVCELLNWVLSITQEDRKALFFFTDDNFARNPHYEAILLGLADHRRRGLRFSFLLEADLAAWKLKGRLSGKGFVELLSEAGCTQIFMGVESVRQQTLMDARKPQNRVEQYREMCDLYHRYGISCHAGYIIGFPNDTRETVREDVETLKQIGFDQVSFFCLTPLPGSEDHARLSMKNGCVESDFNAYDSFQPVTDHPLMSRAQWRDAYNDAWERFFTVKQMAAALKRISPANYNELFRYFMWYRWSFIVERSHPMIAGFYLYRTYADRRPGAPRLSRIKHVAREIVRHVRYLGCFLRELWIFQDVYIQTRWVPKTYGRMAPRFENPNEGLIKIRESLAEQERGLGERADRAGWFLRTFGGAADRAWLNEFWREYAGQKWGLLVRWTWHLRMIPHAIAEVVYTFRFGLGLTKSMIINLND
jgi:radical SAM superfamily enzyme YgiQ (UPF0313 family)